MNYMPRPADDYPQPPCDECRAAVKQLMERLEESCRIQKQHRVRLMLLERSMRKLRRRASAAVPAAGGPQPD